MEEVFKSCGSELILLGAAALLALRSGPASDPDAEAFLPPVVSPNENRVLLVGCDGADDRVIDALLAEGELPTLRRLIDTGVRAPLRTIPDGKGRITSGT